MFLQKINKMSKVPYCKQFKRLERMTNGFKALVQHSDGKVPNPDYDYSFDDNARALIVLSRFYPNIPNSTKNKNLQLIYLDYLVDAKKARNDGLVYNFMNKNREWMDERNGIAQGFDNLQDCCGRGIWAASEFMFSKYPEEQRNKAKDFFFDLIKIADKLDYPNSIGLTIIGLSKYLEKDPENKNIIKLNKSLSEKLVKYYKENSDETWKWFSDTVTYCAARIPHAMLLAGKTLDNKELTKIGNESLEFLIENTFDENSVYHAVGSGGFWPKKGKIAEFDEQPIEPAVMIETLLEAYKISNDIEEKEKLNSAIYHIFGWYEKRNSKNVDMMAGNGAIFDAITPWGLNTNQGAEPLISYLMAASDIYYLENYITNQLP